MPGRSYRIAALLFGSGFCALIYQVAWLRELRLVFGSSTPATAAVLAVFLGGLGLGSLLLSKRADRVARPLALYANLEFGIAVTAAVSTFILAGTREVYIAMGGSISMGVFGGTIARLLLTGLVLLPTTFMMGGTLPAAARASTASDDASRRGVALLYGVNTLGAVTGVALSSFVMLEVFGTRQTLWFACLVNVLVAVFARALDRRLQEEDEGTTEAVGEHASAAGAVTPELRSQTEPVSPLFLPFVLGAAAVTGFAFILMELVWYRMLAPLLGGTSYTFGLILAVALAGIGLGGLAYGWRDRAKPVLLGEFAVTCCLLALMLAVPFALGDRVALLALFLRDVGSMGFAGHVLAWTVVTCVVSLPAALVAGYQFPLLIALLGQREQAVGRHVGLAYAFNTLGSIVGSLAGGFLLIPSLSALGAWRLAVWVLVLLGIMAMVVRGRARRTMTSLVATTLLAVLAVAALHAAIGPTAAWRHLPIGTGRADHYAHDATRNSIKRIFNRERRSIAWEADGRESSVALSIRRDTSFIVNGKTDGSAVGDAGTQVMGGLLGALLQEKPIRSAMVIGLGTGTTVGWLASLPSVERVDVVELEPVILEVARVCSPVNQAVLENPKVNIIIGDAREVLLTTPERYDLIFSEPSNPYRSGIASLFTKEFYTAVSDRINEGGVFVQWLQGYDIDAQSVRIVYATTNSVFPSVESWRSDDTDLILVCRQQDQRIDLGKLRDRIRETGFKEALMNVWRAQTPESVLARFVARPSFARAIADEVGEDAINTDDRNLLEFSFSRALGRPHTFTVGAVQRAAARRGEALPELAGGESVLPEDLYDDASAIGVIAGGPPLEPKHLRSYANRTPVWRAYAAWVEQEPQRVVSEWAKQSKPPTSPVEWMMLADSYAVLGDTEQAEPLIEQLARVQPIEADVITAKLRWAEGKPREAWAALKRALVAYRETPWPERRLMKTAIRLVLELIGAERALAEDAQDVLKHPFAVSLHNELRIGARIDVALYLKDGAACAEALSELEPYPVWRWKSLAARRACYELTNHPLLDQANDDLAEFSAGMDVDIGAGLPPSNAGVSP